MDDYTFPTNYSTYDEENYAYTVAISFILSFTGNLGVVDMDDGDTMIIWPSRYRDTRYGFMITTKEGEPYSIELDENLETEHTLNISSHIDKGFHRDVTLPLRWLSPATLLKIYQLGTP